MKSSGILNIENSTFSNNSGGGIVIGAGTALIKTSVISQNTGGGIQNLSGSQMTINSSTISGNSNGGITNIGTLIVNYSTISNNTASSGGGIRFDNGTVTVNNSTIDGNKADFSGGGLYGANGRLIVNASTISNNSGLLGGGVANSPGSPVDIINSTISGNTAIGTNGNSGRGGGAYLSGFANLINSTIVNNKSNFGGGISTSGPVNSRNTIIAVNTANNSASDFSGTLASQGYNLIGNTTGTTITGTTDGSILGQTPLLGALSNNGGPTLTHALLPGSPAIDAGDPANLLPADQRGFALPKDGDGNGSARADIGAFEVQPVLVANKNDSGVGSLRQALLDIMTAGDAVVFDAGQFNSAQTITLTSGELLNSP